MYQSVFLFAIISVQTWSFATTKDEIRSQKNDPNSFWSQWSKWSSCTSTSICFGGTKTRDRKCIRESLEAEFCTGEYAELKECPEENCRTLKPMIYTDIAEAPLASFISQECNTDVKYSVASKRGKNIPQPVLLRFKEKIMNFLHGFFNLQKFLEKPEVGLTNMTKVCFEPRDLQVKDLPSIYRFNRLVKASLLNGRRLSPKANEAVYGVAVVAEDNSGVIHGIYYATKSAQFGYNTVGYRRWRGQGVLDAL